MKALVFDTGPIISLTMNNLLWILEPLRERFKGKFYITNLVKTELVDKPLNTKRFEFEALQVMQQINDGILDVLDNPVNTNELLDLANKSFKAKGHWVSISHFGEMSAVALALQLNSNAVVIDERTTRTLIENPDSVKNIMQRKLHTKVFVDNSNLRELENHLKGLKVIRSSELVYVAYKLNLLNKYIDGATKQKLLDSLLWGVKLDGCAISKDEIEQVKALES